ncbi:MULTISPECIES: DUF4386 domain-containing protein [unclassified Microbacterium]|uniref:DUF4386 domain-containing protein n=1 Tax=unclassified Microbacterium TaxID=2609290 RepID=UPI00214C4FB8|nr:MULTISPECIES: DUF4386 domain-containing protein [unclassified Microbacterium]MCR2784383.1 DUF4386 domain-containing protein [Microbacterium sp. zg.B96]WIM14799.1 DUF4386 domain-containing protein [Microbacterium sp. zg-B96]
MTRRPHSYARTAGILYLVTHVTSVTAVAAYAGGAIALGVVLELTLAAGCLGTGILLALLLRSMGPARAATFAGLRALEAAVIAAGTLPMLALTSGVTAPATEVLLALHTAAFLVGQGLVISVNTIVLGWLLLDARAVPRALAALGVVGGALVLASNTAQLFGLIPQGGTIAGLCAVPIFAFEIWFAITLITVGLRPRSASPAPALPQRITAG